MKHFGFVCSLLLLLSQEGFTQEWETSYLSSLDREVKESSGLLVLDGRGVTHNDSGNESKLFEIDLVSGDVLRSVFVRNAANVDWEDISRDDKYLFVGDFGNNLGNRTNLRILRIEIDSFLLKDTVGAEFIDYDYADQTSFTSAPFETNYDAEALISYGDSLFIFTKQWGNFKTRVYSLPKIPGEYSISAIDSLDPNFMVTGADIDDSSDLVGIVGYNFSRAFFIPLPVSELGNWSSYAFDVFPLETSGSMQVEAIGFDEFGIGYFTSEDNALGDASLYKIMRKSSGEALAERGDSKIVYPNPASDRVYFKNLAFTEVVLYSPLGKLAGRFDASPSMNISHLEKGVYFAVFYSENRKVIHKHTILKL
jgi:hypothetical protein